MPTLRHAELVSASMVPHEPLSDPAKWILKQVQHDEVKLTDNAYFRTVRAPLEGRMRNLAIASIALSLASCGVLDQRQQTRIMDRIEARAKLPEGWEGVSKYHRYYAYDAGVAGRTLVEAAFVLSERPGREWVPYDSLPIRMDQGCSVITVRYDVGADRVISAMCNGVA